MRGGDGKRLREEEEKKRKQGPASRGRSTIPSLEDNAQIGPPETREKKSYKAKEGGREGGWREGGRDI